MSDDWRAENSRFTDDASTVPAEFTDEGNEGEAAKVFFVEVSLAERKAAHGLPGVFASNGNDDATACVQLIDVGLREFFGACGDDNGIEGGRLWDAESAIVGIDVDIVITETVQLFARFGTGAPESSNSSSES